MGRYKGIVFDLDGTLVHSEVDFVKMKKNMISSPRRARCAYRGSNAADDHCCHP